MGLNLAASQIEFELTVQTNSTDNKQSGVCVCVCVLANPSFISAWWGFPPQSSGLAFM